MLTLATTTKINAYLPAADMRKEFNGLSGITRHEFQADTTDESLFPFINRARDRLKLLHLAMHAAMQDPVSLPKSQVLASLMAQEEELAADRKEATRRNDMIGQLEAKIKQIEANYLTLWQVRFAAKSERYIKDPNHSTDLTQPSGRTAFGYPRCKDFDRLIFRKIGKPTK